MANLTTHKQSQQRYFERGDCYCSEWLERDRKVARWIMAGFGLLAAFGFGAWAVLRSVL